MNLIEINSPRTQKDFEKLKANIRKWKESQFVIIKERIPDRAERQMEFNKLLEQEIKILNVVESKRNQINKQNQEKNMENLLIQLGAPINWTGYKSELFRRKFKFFVLLMIYSFLQTFNVRWTH